jgi:aminoglycoside phosphotransferase family enzyme/predicted kinase
MAVPSHLVEDQSEVIAFLCDPRTHSGQAVERIDTHGAVVVLAGNRAYKLKRAVRYPYMDFSTLELRRRACEAELMLNRRTAPEVYLDVAPIARDAQGSFRIGGNGEIVDWVVIMRRFDQDALFDRLAERGGLDDEIMTRLADEVLRLHARAERCQEQGGAEGIGRVVAGNDAALREAGASVFEAVLIDQLRSLSVEALRRLAPLLDERRAGGLVRRCHGDLHLRNICLIEGRPVLFDAIEFNDQIACIDVLYDLAFLLMDLDRRGPGHFGNLVLNRYLSEGARCARLGELAALAALPLFLATRAAVRAHVGVAVAAQQPDPTAARRDIGEARVYLDRALGYLAPSAPVLVAIGGLSGSGKSSVARALAPCLGAAPGAVILRSDVIRKHLLGRDSLARLGPEAYTAAITARVYETIRARAKEALEAGQAVIADAVHGRPAERAAIEGVAAGSGVAFHGLWLDAPRETLERRVAGREGDASDATVEVVAGQLGYDLGEIGWRHLDASRAVAEVVARASTALGCPD